MALLRFSKKMNEQLLTLLRKNSSSQKEQIRLFIFFVESTAWQFALEINWPLDEIIVSGDTLYKKKSNKKPPPFPIAILESHLEAPLKVAHLGLPLWHHWWSKLYLPNWFISFPVANIFQKFSIWKAEKFWGVRHQWWKLIVTSLLLTMSTVSAGMAFSE